MSSALTAKKKMEELPLVNKQMVELPAVPEPSGDDQLFSVYCVAFVSMKMVKELQKLGKEEGTNPKALHAPFWAAECISINRHIRFLSQSKPLTQSTTPINDVDSSDEELAKDSEIEKNDSDSEEEEDSSIRQSCYHEDDVAPLSSVFKSSFSRNRFPVCMNGVNVIPFNDNESEKLFGFINRT